MSSARVCISHCYAAQQHVAPNPSETFVHGAVNASAASAFGSLPILSTSAYVRMRIPHSRRSCLAQQSGQIEPGRVTPFRGEYGTGRCKEPDMPTRRLFLGAAMGTGLVPSARACLWSGYALPAPCTRRPVSSSLTLNLILFVAQHPGRDHAFRRPRLRAFARAGVR